MRKQEKTLLGLTDLFADQIWSTMAVEILDFIFSNLFLFGEDHLTGHYGSTGCGVFKRGVQN